MHDYTHHYRVLTYIILFLANTLYLCLYLYLYSYNKPITLAIAFVITRRLADG